MNRDEYGMLTNVYIEREREKERKTKKACDMTRHLLGSVGLFQSWEPSLNRFKG